MSFRDQTWQPTEPSPRPSCLADPGRSRDYFKPVVSENDVGDFQGISVKTNLLSLDSNVEVDQLLSCGLDTNLEVTAQEERTLDSAPP